MPSFPFHLGELRSAVRNSVDIALFGASAVVAVARYRRERVDA